MSCPVLVVPAEVEQPPRRVLAARRLLLAAVGVPRFDPRPEGKGAGVQNAGMRAPVGRCLRAGGVGCWVARVFSLVRAAPTSKWSNALVVTSEADLLARWVRRRQEKRTDFLINIAQGGVVRH